MFTVIASAILAGKRLYDRFSQAGITPASVMAMFEASRNLYDSIRDGHTAVTRDDGTPMTGVEFVSDYLQWEIQQATTAQHAAARIEARHGSDGD